MDDGESVEVCRSLGREFHRQRLFRAMRVARYDAGDELTYDITGVFPAHRARVGLEVERFVGGGFAGQVYRVRVVAIEGEPIAGLTVGGSFALKVLVPPSSRSRRFRDLIYAAGFQAPFAGQVNPHAVRAGAIWQKLIRRGARIRFGDDRAVVDVLATLYDERLGSHGELSEWVDGRNWRFEADDHLDLRRKALAGRDVDASRLGSPEYRAKRAFMAGMVELLHEMGAAELARQYTWWTCKSQPNVLKRLESDPDPVAGLTAVDFRAGLALLPVLPMSPGDVPLIVRGLCRGSLVQFDRGDLGRLREHVAAHSDDFADLAGCLAELEQVEKAYRDSQLDVTHHHVRLLYDVRLWGGIVDGLVTSWESRRRVDAAAGARLRRSRALALLFALVGLAGKLGVPAGIGVLIAAAAGTLTWPVAAAAAAGLVFVLPLACRVGRRLWGRADYRSHLAAQLTSADYLRRSWRGRRAETLIAWRRTGRVAAERARRMLEAPGRFLGHWLGLSWLPGGLHRFVTDAAFAREKLAYAFVRPVRLLFDPARREQWLREMVAEGELKGMLTAEEADGIRARMGEPFVQKYLKSLAVHVCTLPVTQVVSVTVAAYVAIKYGKTAGEAWAMALVILGLFQVTPISPGSIVRGLYVVYLVVRERNFRDYNIAVFMGFFKYVGYLAFPVQMAYRYPVLARFMAGHWATELVHIVPVFGERGALLEHAVFDLFYNRLLTIRRRFSESDAARAHLRPRYWHATACAVVGAGVFVLADLLHWRFGEGLPSLPRLWWLILAVPLLAACVVAAGARGARVGRRILAATLCGTGMGVLYGAWHLAAGAATNALAGETTSQTVGQHIGAGLWPVFFFSLLAALGSLIIETRLEKRE